GTQLTLEDTPPRIVDPPQDLVVAQGTKARLRCRVEGHPPPEVTWLKDGEVLGSPQPHLTFLPGGTLLFLPFLPPHQGVYLCRATNPLGVATSQQVTLALAGE
ncbi:ROBO1 protein, partial [Turnix velox]|nr:ROBO1 protein [Turnix velox]